MHITVVHGLVLFAAAALAGVVNSIAGGGTLLTFPALLWAGQPALIANATSTVALWPGALSSAWGYREQIRAAPRRSWLLLIPSFIGGTAGGLLLLRTPHSLFARIVPALILAATLLFLVQEPVARSARARAEASGGADQHAPAAVWAACLVLQLGVGVYGGYFGAGIGIMMLAALGLMGFTNVHQMNGIKNINGALMNGIAAALFVANGIVDWRLGLLMAGGGIVGGFAGSRSAQRIGQSYVRKGIVLIGFGLTVWLFVHGA